MSEIIPTNFSIQVATVNGSGSQSANQILVKALFRMGAPVGAKNLFPSNIAGLPTWFTIRVNENGFTARTKLSEIFMAMNPQTLNEDLKSVKSDGFFFYNSEMKIEESVLSAQTFKSIGIPFKEIVSNLSDSIRMKKLLVNMAYVGVLSELLEISNEALESSISHQFKGKESVIAPNRAAVMAGRSYAQEHLQSLKFPFRVKHTEGANKDQILIDGNTSAAIGLLYGGCTLAAWYPITPSSSLIENFQRLALKYRLKVNNEDTFQIVQAEDELASISMVIGAGWAGARAMTATSGPGLSLMAEAAGLAYYAEVPSVIWNVQRAGPSTGLPTRTMQGDLLSAYTLSHGGTKHVVLLPGTMKDCFEFGQTAFDLAERLQTLVIVLSDLDLGMNLHISKKFEFPTLDFDRGKVLSKEQLEGMQNFGRYKDIDQDGIPYRALPGTETEKAGYFTRGSGHDEYGNYTESPIVYQSNMDRLARKWETAKDLVPKPMIEIKPQADSALLYFGSTHECIGELKTLLAECDLNVSTLCLRALPLSKEVGDFIAQHQKIFIIEQNRDGQLANILRMEFPEFSKRYISVRHYDGLPLTAESLKDQIKVLNERV